MKKKPTRPPVPPNTNVLSAVHAAVQRHHLNHAFAARLVPIEDVVQEAVVRGIEAGVIAPNLELNISDPLVVRSARLRLLVRARKLRRAIDPYRSASRRKAAARRRQIAKSSPPGELLLDRLRGIAFNTARDLVRAAQRHPRLLDTTENDLELAHPDIPRDFHDASAAETAAAAELGSALEALVAQEPKRPQLAASQVGARFCINIPWLVNKVREFLGIQTRKRG